MSDYGLYGIISFFRRGSDEVLEKIFGSSDLHFIFTRFDDETIRRKVNEYTIKEYIKS